jgi:hypothetical protein
MVHFDLDPALLQVLDHLGAQILVLVHGRYGKVPLFVPYLVAQVRLVVVPGVPKTFLRINVVITVVLRLIKADVVEDEKLNLGPPVADVGDAARL